VRLGCGSVKVLDLCLIIIGKCGFDLRRATYESESLRALGSDFFPAQEHSSRMRGWRMLHACSQSCSKLNTPSPAAVIAVFIVFIYQLPMNHASVPVAFPATDLARRTDDVSVLPCRNALTSNIFRLNWQSHLNAPGLLVC
jgi:hypothetical protein